MNKALNILIIETDDSFRNELKRILYELEPENPSVKFNLLSPTSKQEANLVFESQKIDLAFIDYLYFIENNKRGLAINPDCHIVLLIPHEADNRILEIIESVSKYKAHISGHILKDNYSKEVIRVLVKVFLAKLERHVY